MSLQALSIQPRDRRRLGSMFACYAVFGFACAATAAMGGMHVFALYPDDADVTRAITVVSAVLAVVTGGAACLLPGAILGGAAVRSSWAVVRWMTAAMMFLGLGLGVVFGAVATAADPADLDWWQWLLTLGAGLVFATGFLLSVHRVKGVHKATTARGPSHGGEVVRPVRFPEARVVATGKSGIVFVLTTVQYADEQGRARFAKVIIDGWVKRLESGSAWIVFAPGQADRPDRLILSPDAYVRSARREP